MRLTRHSHNGQCWLQLVWRGEKSTRLQRYVGGGGRADHRPGRHDGVRHRHPARLHPQQAAHEGREGGGDRRGAQVEQHRGIHNLQHSAAGT